MRFSRISGFSEATVLEIMRFTREINPKRVR